LASCFRNLTRREFMPASSFQAVHDNPAFHTAILAREAVGIFDDYEELQNTISELGLAGFGLHQISVLGSDQSVKDRCGAAMPAAVMEDHPETPRSPNIAPEELGVAQGVVVGIGMITGVMLTMLIFGWFEASAPVVAAGAIGGALAG